MIVRRGTAPFRKPTTRVVAVALALVASGAGIQAAAAGSDTTLPGESAPPDAGEVDFQALYDEVAGLEGQEALEFFESLPSRGVSGPAVIDFFIDLPISEANEQIFDLYEEEGFEEYLAGYPRGEPFEGFQWEQGSGTAINGPFSELELKLPFTDYVPLAEGPIGDPNETYNIGVTFHGFSHPWLINWADSARWEAERHENVEFTVLDAEFDNNTMASHF